MKVMVLAPGKPPPGTARKIGNVPVRPILGRPDLLDQILNNCSEDNRCLLWDGTVLESGYGQRSVSDKGYRVHRLVASAYCLEFDLFDRSSYICHTCDRKRCCNNDHLLLADVLYNTQDAIAKGLKPAPTPHSRSLTFQQAMDIRSMRQDGAVVAEMAAWYKVAPICIDRIIRWETYKCES